MCVVPPCLLKYYNVFEWVWANQVFGIVSDIRVTTSSRRILTTMKINSAFSWRQYLKLRIIETCQSAFWRAYKICWVFYIINQKDGLSGSPLDPWTTNSMNYLLTIAMNQLDIWYIIAYFHNTNTNTRWDISRCNVKNPRRKILAEICQSFQSCTLEEEMLARVWFRYVGGEKPPLLFG